MIQSWQPPQAEFDNHWLRLTSQETGKLFEDPAPKTWGGGGRILVGTSGYSFPDWQGGFYPQRLPRGEWLGYYARHFPVVEINATYYRLPPASTFARMADATPEGFGFWVKVPGEVTHRDGSIPGVIPEFRSSIGPLAEAGRLRGALAQLPHSFHRSEANMVGIQRLGEAMAGVPLAVEFRGAEWQTPETREWLKSQQLIWVNTDLPDLPGLPKREAVVAAPTGYIRFHGRNDKTWYNPKAGDRYDYNYTCEELKWWVPHIQNFDAEGATINIFFNNCHMGQAVKNAKMLMQLLELDSNPKP